MPSPLIVLLLVASVLVELAPARPALVSSETAAAATAEKEDLTHGLKPIVPSTGVVAVSGQLRIVDSDESTDGAPPEAFEDDSPAVVLSDSMRLAQEFLSRRIKKEESLASTTA